MEQSKPQFPIQNHSVISLVTELHGYFRNLQSYYKVIHGEILDQLETETDAAKTEELKQTLREINLKIDFFHVLNNAISITDTVLHTEKMIEEFGSVQETKK